LTLSLVEKTEVGEPVLLLMTAKSRWYQTDEGAVYTSLRPEEACEIDAKTYALWLTRACEDTLQRMKTRNDSLSAEPTAEGLKAAGVPDTWSMDSFSQGITMVSSMWKPTPSTSCRRLTLLRDEWKQPANRCSSATMTLDAAPAAGANPMTML